MGIMRYDVILSDRATQMMEVHIRFMSNSSIAAARKTRQIMIEAMRSLSEMPERFPFFDAEYVPQNKYHKMYVEAWYLILYQIKDREVCIDYILDCRQDYRWLLK